jgi:hypothetical protein
MNIPVDFALESSLYFPLLTFVLFYPLRTKSFSYRFQVAVTLAYQIAVSFLIGVEVLDSIVVTGIIYVLLSATCFFFPMILVLASSFAACLFLAQNLCHFNLLVSSALALTGTCTVLINRELLLNWQVYTGPTIAACLFKACFNQSLLTVKLQVAFFIGIFALGITLQIRRLKLQFDAMNKDANEYKNDHYKMFNKMEGGLLEACKGDKDEIDRILYGAGMY